MRKSQRARELTNVQQKARQQEAAVQLKKYGTAAGATTAAAASSSYKPAQGSNDPNRRVTMGDPLLQDAGGIPTDSNKWDNYLQNHQGLDMGAMDLHVTGVPVSGGADGKVATGVVQSQMK